MQSKLFSFKRLSIRGRLVLAACFWLGGMIVSAGVVIPKLINDYLRTEVISQLDLAMDEIAGNLIVNSSGQLTLTDSLSDPRFKQPYSGVYWNVTGVSHTLRSRSLWDKNIESRDNQHSFELFGAKGEKLLFISKTIYIPDITEPLNVIVGVDQDPLDDTLEMVIGQLWLILVLLFVGILIFILLQVSWSLRPLNTLQNELKSLEKGKIDTITGDYPAEVSPLIADLNALLFHYQELLHRARNHAGNLSHSIKTPLSVLNNQVAELSDPSREDLMHSIKQVQSQIDYHLSKARMAGSMNILSVKSNPSERIDAISSAFDKVYSSRNLVLVNELDHDFEVAIEQTDLDEILGNVVENAYKWATTLIRIHAVVEQDSLTLFIDDDGIGIAHDQLNDIVKRGYRLDESTPGSGLGLNIVSEMVHSYRGDLSFDRSNLGGLRVILKLVLAP